MLELLKEIASLARTDIHSIRHRAQDGEWIYKPVARPIGDKDFTKHLTSDGPHLGVYLLEPMNAGTRIAVLDLDDHNGAAGFKKVQDAAKEIIKVCTKFGLDPLALRSGGGNGIHLFFKWDKPQSTKDVRTQLATILSFAGLKPGASQHGIAAQEVDIFPKQDLVEEGEKGSLVALPLARQSKFLDADLNVTDDEQPFVSSEPIKSQTRPTEKLEQKADAGEADPELIKQALQHIPASDYQMWMECGMILKFHFPNDDGFGIWNQWSSTADNYPGERSLMREWARLKPNGTIKYPTIFYWAQKNGWHPPVGESPMFSDIWLMLRFVTDKADVIRYIHELTEWRVWNGAYWKRDKKLTMVDMIRETCQEIAREAKKGRKELASAKRVMAVYTLVRANGRVSVEKEGWDSDPWLLGTPFGAFDLKTGLVRKEPKDYISLATTAPIDGYCPRWKQFVAEICQENGELMDFLQLIAGYCLTGLTIEEKLFFLVGPGGNGKSAFAETLAGIMGDYGHVISMNALLMDKKGYDQHPTEFAGLQGKRIAIASETLDGARFNTALVKNLTGGDKIKARYMRQDFFEFKPSHKAILSSNALPLLGRVDKALERRLVLIKLDAQFKQPEKLLKERLLTEAGGILAWAFEGCKRWQSQGLVIPKTIVQSTAEYLLDQDDLQLFINDACTVGGEHLKQSSSELYAAWQEWCGRNGAFAGSMRVFSQRLHMKGYESYKRDGIMVFKKIKLGPAAPQIIYPKKDIDSSGNLGV